MILGNNMVIFTIAVINKFDYIIKDLVKYDFIYLIKDPLDFPQGKSRLI